MQSREIAGGRVNVDTGRLIFIWCFLGIGLWFYVVVDVNLCILVALGWVVLVGHVKYLCVSSDFRPLNTAIMSACQAQTALSHCL